MQTLFQWVFRSFCATEGKWELALKRLGSLSSPIQITAQILLDSSADDYRSRLAKDTVRILTSVCGEVPDNLSRVIYGLVPRSPRAQRPVLLTSLAPCNAGFLILQSFSISTSMPLKKARMGDSRGIHTVLVGKFEGKRSLGRPGVDGRIVLRCIFSKWDVRVWNGSMWLRTGTDGGHL